MDFIDEQFFLTTNRSYVGINNYYFVEKSIIF